MCCVTLLSGLWTNAHANETPHFAIERYQVQGNQQLADTEILRIVEPFTGENRDFGSIQQALEALEETYHARGYRAVKIFLPEQSLENGTVRIEIHEAKLTDIRIEGATHFSVDNIRRAFPSLALQQTPNVDAISTNLRLSNEHPAKQINLQLQETAPNQLRAQLMVRDQAPQQASISLDNSGNRNTGHSRISLQWQHSNLFDHDHILSGQYTFSPEKSGRVNIYGLGYRIPDYAHGQWWDWYATHSDVDSGTIASGVLDAKIAGRGRVLGMRWTQLLTRRENWQHRWGIGLEQRHYDNQLDVAQVSLGHQVTILPLSVYYQAEYQTEKQHLQAQISLSQHLPLGSANNQAAFSRARSGATRDYTLLRYGLNFSYLFANDWQWRSQWQGQWTPDALVSGEQFGLGGADSIRGLRERNLNDDNGYRFSHELYSPNLCQTWQCRAVLLYDFGHVWRNRTQVGEMARQTTASWGLGWRMQAGKQGSVQADWARLGRQTGALERGHEEIHVRWLWLF